MNEEKLIDAMSYISDELIEETDRARSKRALPFPASVAAAFCIMILGILLLYPALSNSTLIFTEMINTEETNGPPEADNSVLPSTDDITVTDKTEVTLKLSVTSIYKDHFTAFIPSEGVEVESIHGEGQTVVYFDENSLNYAELKEGDTVTAVCLVDSDGNYVLKEILD